MTPRTRRPPHPMPHAPRIKHKKFQPFSLKNGPSRAILLLKSLKSQKKPLEKVAKKKMPKLKKFPILIWGTYAKFQKSPIKYKKVALSLAHRV